MSIINLQRIFHPKSVAVAGASEKEGRIGHAIMKNLIQGGYAGDIYPVNPRYKKIFDRPSFASVSDIGSSPDLCIIVTAIDTAPGIVAECAALHSGGAVIVSAGGKESGEKGRETEKKILEAARGSDMRIIGPNCLGVACTRSGLNASFASHTPMPGGMAFITQSGAIFTAVLDMAENEKIGFSHLVSLGSMCDVDFGDVIDYLGRDYHVKSIVMYVENLSRFRNFMSAARAVSRVKPIIVFKAGRSHAGAKAAASHTGAMTGEDAVYDAAFKRAGIVRVKTFEELFDCAELLAKQPKASGTGLVIISNAGGPGVMAADALSDYGAEPAQLSAGTLRQLDEILPPHWSHTNPVDIIGDADPERYRKTAEICLAAPETEGLLLMLAPQALSDPAAIAAALAPIVQNKPFPVLTSWIGGKDMEKGRKIFNQAGIPTLNTPERAVRAFMDIRQHSRNIEMLREIPSRLPRKQSYDRDRAAGIIRKGLDSFPPLLTELESKDLIAAYGIPVNPTFQASTADEAWKTAHRIGFPVALKINSRQITHKTDAGGIALHLHSETEVYDAFADITEKAGKFCPDAEIEGVTVQSMISAKGGYELIVGAKKDRDFGPVILFGMGGIMTEIFQDRGIALPPLNRLLARRLMEETKIFRILKGYRGRPAVNLELLEEILVRVSQLVTDFPEIEELDINPLIADESGVLALDARIVLKPSGVPSPLHMVISPYPSRYETRLAAADGTDLFIRPIRPEDASLFRVFFHTLSPRSVYFRFFSSLKRVTPDMLDQYTQIDYDRQIAMVAIRNEGTEAEEMMGVARIIRESDPEKAEFAVMVSDAWHGRGIGAALLGRCLDIAREQGIQEVWGIVLPENIHMLKLGKKLDFQIKRDPDSNEYLLSQHF
ncbi:MAG: bifunctional acetate--CoA ligase family protein/GNAT family N-acetyltransferase [Desulfococcaceae bacterium]|jgi:acetyltransferase|nr:bifunctional acetate--CoA ligase family protein/GNAT family N-acetyltransferase [Desulfococcaceae bacterium]